MKTIRVEDISDCPFKYGEHHQISENTMGSDTFCALTHDECRQRNCLLKKADEIRIVWKVKE